MIRPRGIAALLLLSACGGRSDAPRAEPASPPPAQTRTAAPADSLVLSTPAGYQVWFTAARTGTDAGGAPCVERAVEIRTDTSRVVVPLLYTNRAPTVLDRGHIRAELTRDCAVTGVYRVELATGRPTKIADR